MRAITTRQIDSGARSRFLAPSGGNGPGGVFSLGFVMASEFATHTLYGAVSLCSPAARTVVVRVWAGVDDNQALFLEHDVLPVVAIRSKVIHGYRRKLATDRPYTPRTFRTHKELLHAGWEYTGSHVSLEPIISPPDLGLTVAHKIDDEFTSWEVVACSWPVEEDETRLAAVVADLGRMAAEKTRAHVMWQSEQAKS